MNRSQRTSLATQTLDIMEQGFYDTATGRRILLKDQLTKSVASSKLYTPGDFETLVLLPLAVEKLEVPTRFNVVNATTLDAAHDLMVGSAGKVLCLNFASAKNPGGGFLNGSQAQEESLARSSCLYLTLLKHEIYYKANRTCGTCLYTDYMIYSPDVLVIRSDEGNLLENPFTISFVTSPAVNAGAIKRNEPDQVSQIRSVMFRRMKYMLSVCANEGYKNLVLGAWGCGVFMNDPNAIADMWYELLVENREFKNRFVNVVFAVLDLHEYGTFAIFKDRFAPLMDQL